MRNINLEFIILFSFFSFLNPSLAQELIIKRAPQEAEVIESITVFGVRDRLYKKGELKDSIAKTELLNSQDFKDKQSSSLTDALKAAVGIRVSNECSLCGAKRVMINGLKGEHTNVLIDGIPLHTMISGFYGLDAVAMAGVGTIEIARGAGASLTAPEAIGGVVNLVSQIPTKNQLELDIGLGEFGYKKSAMMLTGVTDSGESQISLVYQFDERDQFDGDKNGVSESPFLSNNSFTITGSHDFNYATNIRLRLNNSESVVFGGPVLGDTAKSIKHSLDSFNSSDTEELFLEGNVNNRYIGSPWQTLEWVSTKRSEALMSLLHDFQSPLNVNFSLANATHQQNSFYEGIDYYADDEMTYMDIRFNYDVSDEHFFTFGFDGRFEDMRSRSEALIVNANYMSDSFDYDVKGFYIQDSWTPTDDFSLDLAVRFDRVTADFIDSIDQGTEIKQALISPRIDMRLSHNDDWQSRLSIGNGYRAPLSFFESDHGILDANKGYKVDVSEVERSISYNYSINYSIDKIISTFSFAFTEVENLAALSSSNDGVPVLTQLLDKASVNTADWIINYQWNEAMNIGFSAEIFNYNSIFRKSFAIAPIEKRLSLNGLWVNKKWRLSGNLDWIGARDLIDYGYSGFNKNDASDRKSLKAPNFINIDLKIAYQLNSDLQLYLGAFNLLGYNQADDETSPLLYDADGGYNVTYIFAPMRGRTAYLGFDLDLDL